MKIWKIGLGTGLGLALALATASAAPRPRAAVSQNGVPVHMTVTAEAEHGAPPPVIPATDVEVTQGRKRPEVTAWAPAQGANAGLQLLILLDDSSRVGLGSHTASLTTFIARQPATTQVGVGYMHDGYVELTQPFTTDRSMPTKAFRLPLGAAAGAASPYFSLMDFVKRWTPNPAFPRREVLLITDGIDPYSGGEPEDPYVDQTVAAVQRAGIQVFTIYTPGGGRFGARPGPQFWGENYLSTLADQSGGQSLYNGYVAPVSLAPFLNDLQQILGRQYLLTFMAEPEKKPGRQDVKVKTQSGVKLTAPAQVEVPGYQD